ADVARPRRGQKREAPDAVELLLLPEIEEAFGVLMRILQRRAAVVSADADGDAPDPLLRAGLDAGIAARPREEAVIPGATIVDPDLIPLAALLQAWIEDK